MAAKGGSQRRCLPPHCRLPKQAPGGRHLCRCRPPAPEGLHTDLHQVRALPKPYQYTPRASRASHAVSESYKCALSGAAVSLSNPDCTLPSKAPHLRQTQRAGSQTAREYDEGALSADGSHLQHAWAPVADAGRACPQRIGVFPQGTHCPHPHPPLLLVSPATETAGC